MASVEASTLEYSTTHVGIFIYCQAPFKQEVAPSWFFYWVSLTHLKLLGVELEGRVLARGGRKADEHHVAVAMEVAVAEYAVEVERRVGCSVCIHLDLKKEKFAGPRIG